jgi:hypothetical protein
MKKNNKITLVVMLLAAAGFLMQSCGKDSKVAYPPSKITGAITYNGQPVRLMSTNSQLNSGATNGNNLNTLYLTQVGPQPLSGGDLRIVASNEGTFTFNTFDGDYKIAPVLFKSPYKNFDPIFFTLNGDQTVNIPVTPYFWVSNYQTTFVDSVFTATFRLDRILDTYVNGSGLTVPTTLENVRVYFSTTNKADVSANIFSRTFTTPAQGVNVNGNCTITVNLKGTGMSTPEKQNLKATTGKLWANVAIKIKDITDALYQQNVALK